MPVKSKEEMIKKEQKAIVTKANNLIQKSRYCLNIQQQKMILYVMSKIQPTDTFLTEYKFELKHFCEVCGVEYTNSAYLKDNLLKLKHKGFWLTIDDKGTESLVDWFSVVRVNRHSGTIRIKFHEDLVPFLLELKKNFTSYSIYPTLVMKSKYSVRLYELLKSYQNLNKWYFDLDDLKKKLDAEKYLRYADFRRFVIEVAVNEINTYTDLEISYEAIKESRQYVSIQFFIDEKNPAFIKEAEKKVEAELENQQLSFNDDDAIDIEALDAKGKREPSISPSAEPPAESLVEDKPKRGRPRKKVEA